MNPGPNRAPAALPRRMPSMLEENDTVWADRQRVVDIPAPPAAAIEPGAMPQLAQLAQLAQSAQS